MRANENTPQAGLERVDEDPREYPTVGTSPVHSTYEIEDSTNNTHDESSNADRNMDFHDMTMNNDHEVSISEDAHQLLKSRFL